MTITKIVKQFLEISLLISLMCIVMQTISYADQVSFDKTSADKGLLKVSVSVTGSEKIKMIIQKDDKKYIYDLKNDIKNETFPLQLGNGEYKISVLKNISDNKYSPISSDSITVNLTDPNIVFLQSIQNISWGMGTQAVSKAAELVKGFKEGNVRLDKVYEFVTSNYKYDYDKATNVQTGYVPVVDETYITKKGICYDYSSMFAAMLRSFGVPTRLIKGYSSNVDGYHAWNEVYDEKSKNWIVIDTTYDAQLKALKRKGNLNKPATDYQTVNFY